MEGHMWFRHIFSRYALMTSYEMSRSVACLPYAATSYQFAVVSGMKEQLWEAVLAADPQNQSLMVAFVYAFSCESSVTALPQLYLFIFFTFSFLSFFFFVNKMTFRSFWWCCVYVCERKRLSEIESIASPQVCLQSSMSEPHRRIDNDCLRNECIIAARLSCCRHATSPPRRSLSNAIVRAAGLTHPMHIIGAMVAGRDEVVREWTHLRVSGLCVCGSGVRAVVMDEAILHSCLWWSAVWGVIY